MSHPRTRHGLGLVSLVTAFAVAITMALVSGGTAQSETSSARASKLTTVAHAPSAKLRSAISGTTDNGNRVTGSYTPLKFIKKDGHVKVRGIYNGVIHRADGTTKTFTVLRTSRLQSVNGTAASNGSSSARTAQRASCDILNLVLGPLDLDLLGLQIHLDKVVLDIVAVTGAGNLLGNLLCRIVGLLDGGLGGQLGKLVNLLNQILQRLLTGL